ncbi:GNAT family N-acetyltransferase [Natrononativus amylolyticus]|uniref:GNAT family N-acetyltransferase n=1 Tax=Natrononativus amylolyticus TaxID=2963434 RepID=UPI0020CC35CF|nr:GNAT family protein [Natrononativus amylolyticus]
MSHLFPETIETDRLRLELATPETVDLFAFYEICSSDPDLEEVTRYLTWDPHETPKETLEFLELVGKQYDENEGASYLLFPRDGENGAGKIAGGCGFDVDWEKRTMTLGMWLRKRFWGQGYSGERAAAFFELAFERLDLDLVAVTAHVDNENSNRAIERYVEAHGGGRDGLLRNWEIHGGEPVDCYRYSVSREEWLECEPAADVPFRDRP